MSGDAKSREEELSIAADEVRSKLLRTVAELDQRRHEALDLRLQVKRHLKQVVAASGLMILATAGTAAFVVYRVATASERRRRYRWRLAKDVWGHPDRALRAERRALFADIGRAALVACAWTLMTQSVRRALRSRAQMSCPEPSMR